MVKEGFMTSEEFKKFIDSLVDEYNAYERFHTCILEFLDFYFGNKEEVMRVNPIDLIRELHKCNEEGKIMMTEPPKDYRYEFTVRFKILMGICELIEFCTRPAPKFKYRDIITDNKSVWYVMDVNGRDSEYYVDDLGGNSCVLSFNFVNLNCKKIGEVTDDVMKRANPLYKSK